MVPEAYQTFALYLAYQANVYTPPARRENLLSSLETRVRIHTLTPRGELPQMGMSDKSSHQHEYRQRKDDVMLFPDVIREHVLETEGISIPDDAHVHVWENCERMYWVFCRRDWLARCPQDEIIHVFSVDKGEFLEAAGFPRRKSGTCGYD